jgi:hypothetical protein
MKKRNVYWDIECYTNYFYVRFTCPATSHTYEARLFNDVMELGDRTTVGIFIQKHTLIGFNTDNYDLPMLGAFLSGSSNKDLKYLSDQIVNSRDPWWLLSRKFPKVKLPNADTIDLVGATPLIAGLKAYACRIHTKTLEDLPLHPSTIIEREHINTLETYCANDLEMTRDIHLDLQGDISLREDMTKQYGIDFRSKSGPQIAEGVLRLGLSYPDKRPGKIKPFRYDMPDFIAFDTPELQAVQDLVAGAKFSVNNKNRVPLPDELNVAIDFDGATYKLGIGGLHSQEKSQAVVAGDLTLGEWDVGSMYPSIILGQGLYPKHLGEEFCDVYREVFDTRMAAKRDGNKMVSDSLKLVLNSSFGKFGSHYSFLYSPELLIQTTLTGQLSLLMLIEMFSLAGIKTVSANTDGVVIHHNQHSLEQRVVREWEKRTGMILEWTPYLALYSESVNSYVAITEDGVKLKGTYAPASISKGYQNEICVDAIVALLAHDTPISQTINSCTDVRKFLTMRGVQAPGGVWRGEDVGRVVRWYVSTAGEAIRYKKNGNKVAGSDNAVPMMTLCEMPDDLDRGWYIDRANALLKKLGYTCTPNHY